MLKDSFIFGNGKHLPFVDKVKIKPFPFITILGDFYLIILNLTDKSLGSFYRK